MLKFSQGELTDAEVMRPSLLVIDTPYLKDTTVRPLKVCMDSSTSNWGHVGSPLDHLNE